MSVEGQGHFFTINFPCFGTWTIRTLDDSDLVNSDHILVNSDLFTGQFGPHEIRSELTKKKRY